jgi:serine/threonine protein kinase
VAPAAAGKTDVEQPAVPRHDGLLNRLSGGRARTTSGSPPASEASDQVHSATPLPIGTRLGTFEVNGVLHRDLSGIVYVGEDRSSPGRFAIKEYLPATLADRMASGTVGLRSLRYKPSFEEGKDRFLSNGRMLAALDEPALIRVLRCWKQNGTAYMAMPLYEGQTLSDVLRVSVRPSESWLKAMLGPLLDALTTLHRFDCHPCNVTPDNIVMLQDGTPLLFAFGAGRRTATSSSGDLRHDLNPGFAPIEQYAHDPTMPEGPWTDVYAVAAVIRFAITGKALPALAARMAADTLQPLRNTYAEYSPLFLDAVDRGVAVLPRDRPQTIADFRKVLGIHPLGSGATPTPPADVPPIARNAVRWTTKFSEPDPVVDDATMEGTRAAIASVDQIVLPPLGSSSDAASDGASQAAMQSSPGRLPRKLVLQVFVVGLFALGILLWWTVQRWQAAPATVDRVAALPPVASSALRPSPPVAAVPAPSESAAPPSIAAPTGASASAGLVPTPSFPVPSSAVPTVQTGTPSAATAVATVPHAEAKPAESVPLVPKTGRVRLSIKPWGEVLVDGKARGVSPPLKELSIAEGRHRIQIRNGDFPGFDRELDIKPGRKDEIAWSFKAP